MATLELVEKLRQHSSVTYDEAREALDACGDDLLDAIIYLEKKGKIPPPQSGGAYTTEKQQEPPKAPPRRDYEIPGETFPQMLRRAFKWLGSILRKGNRNLFVIYRRNTEMASLPVTLLVILLMCSFHIALPLMVVGLFFGFRYRFRGADVEGTGANEVMDSVPEPPKTSSRA
jgi:hypothetical protein